MSKEEENKKSIRSIVEIVVEKFWKESEIEKMATNGNEAIKQIKRSSNRIEERFNK